MKHLIFSTYEKNLHELDLIKNLQKSVCLKFGVEIEQVEFRRDDPNVTHAMTLFEYLQNQTETWDYVTFFDIDCIPISADTIPNALSKVKDKNSIYANIQASNVFDYNLYKTPPFASPSFLTFSYEVWQKTLEIWSKNTSLPAQVFDYSGQYQTPEGHFAEADVAEVFSREHQKHNTNVQLAYPIYTMNDDYTWRYSGHYGDRKFKYGNGTIFESLTYHNFQIRIPDKQHNFIKYCNYLLDS